MRRAVLVLLAISLYASEIRISEVMANPQGSEYENEYIELFNRSNNVIHINGWIMSDGTGIDTITFVSGPKGIQPLGYALILDPSYDLENGQYSGLIPEGIPVYSISTDATFGSGGLSNSGESAIIRSADTTTTTSMSWSESTDNGYSWERVDLNSPDSIAIWKQSLVENGTPGYENSVVLPSQDLSISQVMVEHDSLQNQLRVTISIKNQGSSHAVNADLIIDLKQHGENLHDIQRDLPMIRSGDSTQWVESIDISICGWMQIANQVFIQGDGVPENNTGRVGLYVNCQETPIILNEIMPTPFPGDEEWVEIHNRSDRIIDLLGWQFSDANPTRHLLADSSYYLIPGDYLLLAGSSQVNGMDWSAEILEIASFPTLNNDADECTLFQPDGSKADQVSYAGTTGLVEGRSLERVRVNNNGLATENWRICVDESGSTPGSRNSLYLENLNDRYLIELDPNPFLPSDKEKGILNMYLELPVEQAIVSVSIYDLAGREIAVPIPMQVVAHRSHLSWDGTASYGGIADTGLYICRLIIDDMNGQVSEFYKKVYLVND